MIIRGLQTDTGKYRLFKMQGLKILNPNIMCLQSPHPV